MTRLLIRLADIGYRRRGRMVLGWIVGAVVIIGVGSSLAGEFNADYDTPGSESKAASDLTKQRFDGYSGQEIYVVWKAPGGARSARAERQMNAFFAEAERVDPCAPVSEGRVHVRVREGVGVVGSRRCAVVLPTNEPRLDRLIRLQPVAVRLDLAVPVDDLDDLAHEQAC